VAAQQDESREYVAVAQVIKPQGNRGEVIAELLTDFPEKFTERKKLSAVDKSGKRVELTLEDFWPHKGRMVLKFVGVDSINQAELLKGCTLQIAAEERVKLADGTYYTSELIGCELSDASSGGRVVGKVAEVSGGFGDAPMLTVSDGKREYMVPFAEEFLVQVDVNAKRIEMRLPAGLLEVDAPTAKDKKAAG